MVEKLLECGAEVNIFNIPHGKSVLHYAVHLQREDLMHLFLKAGADITAKGKTDSKTPYELANDMKQAVCLSALCLRYGSTRTLFVSCPIMMQNRKWRKRCGRFKSCTSG